MHIVPGSDADEEMIKLGPHGITGTPVPSTDTGAPAVTAEPDTPLHHAQTCAQYLGPIPAMSCGEAYTIPITVDGVTVTDSPETCDRPSALTGTCVPMKTGRWIGTHHDGSTRPEVVFMNFCREGRQTVIGHNSETGATCFFHLAFAEDDDEVHPGSEDPDYDLYWQTAEEVASDNCEGCHQADPWLHTPSIDQVKDPDDPSLPLVPLTGSRDSPYIIIGEAFSQPIQEGAPDNTCTSCHRAQCSPFAFNLGELQMPAPFHGYTPSESNAEARAEIAAWCETLDLTTGGSGGEGEVEECPEDFDSSEPCEGTPEETACIQDEVWWWCEDGVWTSE